MSGLFEFLSTTTGGVLLVAGTLGFSAAACSAPRWATAARACEMNAATTPLWLLLPILLGFVLT